MFQITEFVNRRARWGLVALMAGLVSVPSLSRADADPPRLGMMLATTDVVAVGTVVAVDTQSDTATINVTHRIVGASPDTVTVPADGANPEGHPFEVGQRLLAFLKIIAGGQGSTHAPVSLGAIFRLSEATEAATVQLASLVIPSPGPTLGAVAPFLTETGAKPSLDFVAIVLYELSARDLSSQGGLLSQIVCDTTGTYRHGARLWAIRDAGPRQIATARGCLASLVRGAMPTRANPLGGNMEIGVAAAVALGEDPAVESDAALRAVMKLCLKKVRTEDTLQPPGLLLETALALGKIHSLGAPGLLYKAALKSPMVPIASTAVHALGLIGDARAVSYLARLAPKHPNPIIREQAATAAALFGV